MCEQAKQGNLLSVAHLAYNIKQEHKTKLLKNPLQEGEDPMGSLPNLHRLEEAGVRLNREEAARLASDRRQAVSDYSRITAAKL